MGSREFNQTAHGHALGAASAIEAAICWHMLHHKLNIPAQVNDNQFPEDFLPVRLAQSGDRLEKSAVISNSFAFGGNNVSLIFGVPNE